MADDRDARIAQLEAENAALREQQTATAEILRIIASSPADLQSVVDAAGRHLLGLINDVLDLSKIEAGKMDLYLSTFDAGQLVRDVQAIVQPLVEKNGNMLVVTCLDDIGQMHADQTKVRQTLFNLLSNAAKFTEAGTIELRVAPTPQPPPPAAGEGEQADGLPSPAHGGGGFLASTDSAGPTLDAAGHALNRRRGFRPSRRAAR